VEKKIKMKKKNGETEKKETDLVQLWEKIGIGSNGWTCN